MTERACWHGGGQFPPEGAPGQAWKAAGYHDAGDLEHLAWCFLPDEPDAEGGAFYCAAGDLAFAA